MKDLIVIGGGQSALACGYYLRRTGLDYLILDNQRECGGAWLKAWESLTLFSPAEHSSLPGWMMPKSESPFPSRKEVIAYLCEYEKRYKLPVERPVNVESVDRKDPVFEVKTDGGVYQCRAIISATGTWQKPFIPDVDGREDFNGKQLHSAFYLNPDEFKGLNVLVVGEGNSGAQILAEVSKVAETAEWATRKKPEFLPDDVDGRVLFDMASARYYAEQKGEKFDAGKFNLGNIVMVPSVKEARDRNVLQTNGEIAEMYADGVVWDDGSRQQFDAIIWCTGFGYATDHLNDLVKPDQRGKIPTDGTRVENLEGLWLVGYGGWTGFASATIIGVGRSARQTAKEVEDYLAEK